MLEFDSWFEADLWMDQTFPHVIETGKNYHRFALTCRDLFGEPMARGGVGEKVVIMDGRYRWSGTTFSFKSETDAVLAKLACS